MVLGQSGVWEHWSQWVKSQKWSPISPDVLDSTYVVAAAAAMYQEQVLSYKYLDESLDEGRFVFECILAGTLQAFIYRM